MSYIDGFLLAVPAKNKEAYLAMARVAAKVFLKHGATRVVEAWGDDIKPGKVNDFRTAVIAKEDEQVLFSWIEWPSKEVRDAGMANSMQDPEMVPPDPDNLPFAGDRVIFGGFRPILDQRGH